MIYQRIKYFLKAAELGSFSKAAGHMFVSAQALTKQISLLEKEIGGKLFERSPQGIVLTSLGEFARKRFEKIDHEMEVTFDELKLQAIDHKDRINVGIFSALPQESLVTPMVSFLLACFPNYQISLNLVDLEEGRKLLMDGKVDILLTNTHEEDNWNHYRCLSFNEHEARIMVSLRHPWAVKDEITVEDMRQQTFLKMNMNYEYYKVPPKQSFYENIPCKNIQRVANFDTMFALLQQGDSFAVFPMAFMNMDIAKIKSFKYPGRTFTFRTALIYNPNSSLKGIEGIIKEIEEAFDLKRVTT